MKYLFPLVVAALISACENGDKAREDFPDMTQPDAKEANSLIIDDKVRDTVTTRDTTPGMVKPAAE